MFKIVVFSKPKYGIQFGGNQRDVILFWGLLYEAQIFDISHVIKHYETYEGT